MLGPITRDSSVYWKRSNYSGLSVAIAIVVIVFGASVANAAVTACSATISSCGCTINKTGIYKVTAKLDSSQGLTSKNGCIDVSAANVKLFLQGFDVAGAAGVPAGIGIHLLPTANGSFVEGTKAGASTGFSTIRAWDIGIEDDASNTLVEDFIAQFNGTAGVLVTKGHNNNVTNFGSDNNDVYGVWLKASNANQVNSSETDANEIGLYVGCSSNGIIGAKCAGVAPSKNNKIYNHFASTNGAIGIAIDLGNTNNIVTDTQATANTVDDLSDQNANCDNNLWILNSFVTANAACIPNP
jgi:hypothetical protein